MQARSPRAAVLFMAAMLLLAIGFFAVSSIGTVVSMILLVAGLVCGVAAFAVLRSDSR